VQASDYQAIVVDTEPLVFATTLQL
jgi:hypothetical protein